MIARVVLVPAAGDAPLLDYALDERCGDVRPGTRVIVPLGTRRAVGVVTELADASSYARLKPIAGVLDTKPLLDESLLRLCRWMAEYYLCTLSEALAAAMPGSLRVTI